MTFRRNLIWTNVAFAAALTIGVPSMAGAQAPPGAGPGPGAQAAAGEGQGQGRGRGRGAPPFTPATGAKDLKAVMFNWGWYTGMLRSSEEYDLLMSLDYQGKGTMQVGGQPCNVTMYRSDISYQTSGERIRVTGTRPNGQSCNTIEVVSGAYAWNEDIQGAELVPGKGKATPMAATVEERMIRLWSGPQGAFKAAFAGTSPDAPPMTPRPQRLAADVMTIGKTSVAWVGNKPVLTYPIPGVPTATATTTLDAKWMPESVVVKNGATTYEFTYSDYKDWNNPLNPAEALYAGRMIGKAERHRRPRHHDDADGNGTDVCRGACAGKRQSGDQAHASASQLDAAVRARESATSNAGRRHAAAGQWEAGSDWSLGRRLQSDYGRWRSPMRPDPEGLRRPAGQLLGGLRMDLALTVRRSMVAPSTNPSSGTRCRHSTSGRTRKTRS